MQKDSLKIGVWINCEYRPQEGGGYSYYEQLISEIDKYNFDSKIDIIFVSNDIKKTLPLSKTLIQLTSPKSTKLFHFINNIFKYIPLIGSFIFDKISVKIKNKESRHHVSQLKKESIHLLYYPIQLTYEVKDFPFIATSWDLGHRSCYSFPEFILDGKFEYREFYYTNILPKALAVFTESQAGKEELKKYFTINENSIKIVPLFPGKSATITLSKKEEEDILTELGVQSGYYFFYPAQFWAHKNHFNLLKAFRLLLTEHKALKLVLCGSDKGNLNYIKTIAESLSLKDSVRFLGFVESEKISCLYRNAIALVMPTYLGPTNMPLIEALALNCPVLCSDLTGHKEQMGDSAIYFDQHSCHSIYGAMLRITSHVERNQLLEKAEQNIAKSYTVVDAVKAIEIHLLNIVSIRLNWSI